MVIWYNSKKQKEKEKFIKLQKKEDILDLVIISISILIDDDLRFR